MKKLKKTKIFFTIFLIIFCLNTAHTVPLTSEEFYFYNEFTALLDNFIANHYEDFQTDPGITESKGAIWLMDLHHNNPSGCYPEHAEGCYTKGDASLFASELLYKMTSDGDITDVMLTSAGLPVKSSLKTKANRSIDHVIDLYKNFSLLQNPEEMTIETGTALPALIHGIRYYDGDLNSSFHFRNNLWFLLNTFSILAKMPFEGNPFTSLPLYSSGALGITSYYNMLYSETLMYCEDHTDECENTRCESIFINCPYRADSFLDKGLDLLEDADAYKFNYIDPPDFYYECDYTAPGDYVCVEEDVMSSYVNGVMFEALTMAYKASGDADYKTNSQLLMDAFASELLLDSYPDLAIEWNNSEIDYPLIKKHDNIHLAPNNLVVTALLTLAEASRDDDPVFSSNLIYLANRIIETQLSRLYVNHPVSGPMCKHHQDDGGSNYYCTGCNFHLLTNIYALNAYLYE